MKVIIKCDNITNDTMSVFTGDGYNFFFYNLIPDIDRLPLSTYEVIGDDIIQKIEHDEIIYFEGKGSNIILNNFIWFARTGKKDLSIVLDGNNMLLYYFKNVNCFKLHQEGTKLKYNKYNNDNNIVCIDEKAVFSPHWGWTDFVISVSIINYYSLIFKEVVILVYDEFLEFVSNLLPNNKVVGVGYTGGLYPSNILNEFYNNDYIFLVDGHQSTQCFSNSINYMSLTPNTDIQKMNFFLLSRSVYKIGIEGKIKQLDKYDIDFDERVSFYTLSFLKKSDITKYFDIVRNFEIEEVTLRNYNTGSNYATVNYIGEMKKEYFIGKNVFDLTNKSMKIVDMLGVIENSYETHIYDSLYGVLIYLMYFKMGFFNGKKIYYHRYARRKIHKFFDNNMIGISKDWVILD